jgi:hypothetical protein
MDVQIRVPRQIAQGHAHLHVRRNVVPLISTGIPVLIGPSQWCSCNALHYDSFGDYLETYQVKSVSSQVHDWVVYRLGDILGGFGWSQSYDPQDYTGYG